MNPPTTCPVCGAYSLTQEGSSSALLAVADVLVLKALEKIGTRIVRQDRSRFAEMERRAVLPYHQAHTVWPTDDDTVTKALKGAWDVVPALLEGHGFVQVRSEAVVSTLDDYVHDLVITGTRHQLTDLAYRFTTRLGLPVYVNQGVPS